jgi:hypothetical protein
VELEGQDGEPARSISFVGIEFLPLDYRQLAEARLHVPVTVPFDWHNARVLETDIPGVDIDKIARGHATLESTFSSTTVSLQRGGWLPSGLAVSRPGVTVLPDRNTVSQIEARYEGGTVVAENRDFLDMLATSTSASIPSSSPWKAMAAASLHPRSSRPRSRRRSRSSVRRCPKPLWQSASKVWPAHWG